MTGIYWARGPFMVVTVEDHATLYAWRLSLGIGWGRLPTLSVAYCGRSR